MAITAFTVPATTATDTIVARLVSDNNLISFGNNDFSLHRADTDAELSATISNSKIGNHFWDITVQNTSSYRGQAYVEIRARAFRDLQTLQQIPVNALRSNTFSYVLPAPENFSASDGVNTSVLRWDVVSGNTYELRVDSGLWQDVTSPHTVTGLLSDADHTYELRVKGDGNGIATVRKRTLVYPIEDIDEQFIPVGTENYELIIGIRGQHKDARVNGLQEGFYQHFENLSDGNSRLYVRSEEVTRLIAQAIWSVQVSDTDWRVTDDILYNVVPVGPILEDPGRQTLWIGVPFRLRVETLNIPTVQRGESELVGLKFETVQIEDRSYIESAGMLPVGTKLTFDAFNSDYYVENSGGNDTLQVPVDIRDDPVAPIINAISNIPKEDGYAAFTVEASLSAGTQPVTWSIDGIPGATIVPETGDTVTINIPARLKGTHTATLTASNGRFQDTEQFSLIVAAPITVPTPGTLAWSYGPFDIVIFSFSTPIDDGGTGSLTNLEWSLDGGSPVSPRSSRLSLVLDAAYNNNILGGFLSGGNNYGPVMTTLGRHTLRVRLSNSQGTSAWSNTVTFIVRDTR